MRMMVWNFLNVVRATSEEREVPYFKNMCT